MPITEVGWFIEETRGGLVYTPPEIYRQTRKKALSVRAVQACPSINELENRLYLVRFPYYLRLRCVEDSGRYMLYNVPDGTRIDSAAIEQNMFMHNPSEWRSPDRPVIQINAPYVFVADEEVHMSQMPPYLDYEHNEWPGVMSAGRYQIDYWPRTLSWAFEWVDFSKDLIFKRGSPWFYVYFEGPTPSHGISLVRSKETPAVKKYRNELGEVLKFMSNPFSLKEEALARRPKKLLIKDDKDE